MAGIEESKMDILKQVAFSVAVWSLTGIIAWLVAKSLTIRQWFNRKESIKTVAIALLLSGVIKQCRFVSREK